MDLCLPRTPAIVDSLARLARLRERWNAGPPLSAQRLESLFETARLRGAAASCRLAGIRVTDEDVAAMLANGASLPREGPEILGYARAQTLVLQDAPGLLGAEEIRRLHAVMMGGAEDGSPSPWRAQPLYREVFDVGGRTTGRVFPTLPPHLIESKMEDLLTWLEFGLRLDEDPPQLVVAGFLLGLLAASPFERGNGRLARLLAERLLVRSGDAWISCDSLESRFEELRQEYYDAFDRSYPRLWTGETDVTPWVELFCEMLDRHRMHVEDAIRDERRVEEYPPLQQAILRTVREHGSVDAALLLESTGANRNTLKDNLRRLVRRGVLEKTGERRSTRYRIPALD